MSHNSSASESGQAAGDAIKQGLGKVHGAGEALRGNINTFADSLTGTDTSKDEAVARRGEQELNTGRYQGTGAGVTPADREAEKVKRAAQGEYHSTGTAGTGSGGFGSRESTMGSGVARP